MMTTVSGHPSVEPWYAVTAPDLGWPAVRRALNDQPDAPADELAAMLVSSLSNAQVRAFALAYVMEVIDSLRRHDARLVEEAAEREATPSARPIQTPAADYLVGLFEQYRADPTGHSITNRKDRKTFRQWMGDAFEPWYTASLKRVEALNNPDKLELFEADWHPEGWHAYFNARLVGRMREVVEDEARRIRLEVTSELLATVFALGDGLRVTWGTATVEQHQQRISLLLGNIAGNTETAARHQAAIGMIQAAGGTCLLDSVE